MEEVEEIEEEIETDANADVTADRASLDTQQVIEDDASTYPRCDFSGVWKRSRTENFEAFLGIYRYTSLLLCDIRINEIFDCILYTIYNMKLYWLMSNIYS